MLSPELTRVLGVKNFGVGGGLGVAIGDPSYINLSFSISLNNSEKDTGLTSTLLMDEPDSKLVFLSIDIKVL